VVGTRPIAIAAAGSIAGTVAGIVAGIIAGTRLESIM
jgi:hypothetical protein